MTPQGHKVQPVEAHRAVAPEANIAVLAVLA